MTPKPGREDTQLAQDNAIKQFRLLRDHNLVCLDTETTGLEGQVWQLAAIDQRTLMPLLALTCCPSGEWSERAAEMRDAQGIDPTRYPVSEVFQAVVQVFLHEHSVVVWNTDFDRPAIERTWPNAGDGAVVACAMRAYAPLAEQWSEIRGAWKHVSLERACELERIDTAPLPAAHSAYGDAVRLALLIGRVAERETHTERDDREHHEAADLYDTHGQDLA